jgi:hypothetical protein
MDLVAPGSVWWCASKGDRFCTRVRAECGGPAVSCKRTANVFAYTIGTDDVISVSWLASPFATRAACEASRKGEPRASACTAVGATKLRPISVADIPGTGWLCYTNHGQATSGACARTVDLCARLRGLTVQGAIDDSSEPGDCIPAESAWATRIGHAVIARATKPACEHARKMNKPTALATPCAQLP